MLCRVHAHLAGLSEAAKDERLDATIYHAVCEAEASCQGQITFDRQQVRQLGEDSTHHELPGKSLTSQDVVCLHSVALSGAGSACDTSMASLIE